MTFFDYFQIFTVFVIVCVIATRAIYLRVSTGINPIVIGRSKGPWRIVEVLSLGCVLLWMAEVVMHALHSPYDLFPDALNLAFLTTLSVKIAGLVLASLGLVTFILAFLSFGNSWRIGIDRTTPGTLITGGIFGLTRNPIYVAFNLCFIGVFLINGTWFFLIFALMAAGALHLQIVREEEFLRKQYGDSFEFYCKQTARYLIW